MYKYLILGLLSLSCARHSSSDNPKPITPMIQQLIEKVNLYEELVQSHQDSNGFIGTEECDATLFSGLLAAAYPGEIDILTAKDSNDVWHRRPAHDCGPSFKNSRSTISRDMMIGVFWGLWANKELDEAIRLMDYLKENTYVMPGEGTLGELLLNPGMINTLAELIKALDGPEYKLELALPTHFTVGKGFVNHLTVWHIHLRGSILGSISSRNFSVIKTIAEQNQHNPLYQAVYHKYLDNDMTNVVQLLLDITQWPADRLPTSSEHCATWPVQRDIGKDWLPCPEQKPNTEHSGAELLIIYKLFIMTDKGGAEDENGPSGISK